MTEQLKKVTVLRPFSVKHRDITLIGRVSVRLCRSLWLISGFALAGVNQSSK